MPSVGTVAALPPTTWLEPEIAMRTSFLSVIAVGASVALYACGGTTTSLLSGSGGTGGTSVTGGNRGPGAFGDGMTSLAAGVRRFPTSAPALSPPASTVAADPATTTVAPAATEGRHSPGPAARGASRRMGTRAQAASPAVDSTAEAPEAHRAPVARPDLAVAVARRVPEPPSRTCSTSSSLVQSA
jgi:hypothetical protein